MSITDELRKALGRIRIMAEEQDGCSTLYYISPTVDELTAIADRIDAEHDREMIEIRTRGWSNGYDEGFASADDWLAQHEDAMAEHGWVKLPVDADGESIRVGDVVDVMPTDKFTGHKNVVVTSVIFKHSAVLVTVDTDERPFTFMPNRICHYHEPTVEDVLLEFAANIADVLGGDDFKLDDNDELYAEYAKRLRLAEEADA